MVCIYIYIPRSSVPLSIPEEDPGFLFETLKHLFIYIYIYMLKASMNATSTLPFRFVHGRTFVHPRATFSAGVEGKRLPAVGWKGFRPCQCFDIGSGAWGNRPWAPRRILAPP